MKKIYKSKKGFTLIELLAVIVIIGILMGISIVAVMRFIDKAREEQIASQEKVLAIAAQHYLQENRGLLPKNIGETTRVTADLLINNNYLTQDIQNSKKESCRYNSYVDAKKESQTKYSYKAHICDDNIDTQNPDVPEPSIYIDFRDASNTSFTDDKDILERVSEARFVIEYNGSKDETVEVAIEGYSYSILVDPTGGNNLKESYNSGTLSANYATKIVVDKDNNLVDYIDVTGYTTVAIKATVRNIEGGIVQVIKYVGETPEESKYHDSKKPECVNGKTIGEAKDGEWINLNTDPEVERKITVTCNDGSGSGCLRSTFTRTWDGFVPVETDNIVIRDNAGNEENCQVRVNVDKVRPIINIDAYPKAGKDVPRENSSSVLTGTKSTADAADGTVTIDSNEYLNLYSGYMNKKNYPNGVIYKVDLSDSLAIDRWTWEVNGDFDTVESETSEGYEDVSLGRLEATSGNVNEELEKDNGVCSSRKKCSFYVKLFNNGYRKGVLTVYDKAGNYAKYTIYADINREVPSITSINNSSNNTWDGDWTSDSVRLKLAAEKSKKTNIDIGDYYYSYNNDAEEFSSDNLEAHAKWVKLDGGTGLTSFNTQYWNIEMSEKTYIIVCDIAGNCSDVDDKYSTNIMIDRTAPIGLKLTGYKKKSSVDITEDVLNTIAEQNLETINDNEWNKGWAIIIPGSATDPNGSGKIKYKVNVTGASNNVTFDDEINEKGRSFRNVDAEGISVVSFIACDAAGNCSSPVKFRVKLDRTAPITPSITNLTGGNWSTVKVTTDISSKDLAVGIGKYYYSYDEEATTNGNNPKSQWVEIPDGTNKESFSIDWEDDMNETVYIKACDKLGNCSLNSTIIRIDANPPTTPEITNPNGTKWAKQNFSLEIKSSDAGSGIKEYQYTYSSSASEVGEDPNTQWKADPKIATEIFETTKISLEGNRLMYWRACDDLGNCSEKSSVRIKLDKTKPKCGTITASTNNSESGVSGSITCTDDVSDCKNDSYDFGPFTETDTITIEDSAGNKKECEIPITSTNCTNTAPWIDPKGYHITLNSCPEGDDDPEYFYKWFKCSASDLPGVCTSDCIERCGNTALSLCHKRVCCVKKRKSDKICYLLDQ